MSEVIDSSSDSQPSAFSPSVMALDVSAVSYESGREALQLAVDGDGNIQEIAWLLEQEAQEHWNSSSLDPTGGASDEPVSCDHHTALGVAASAGHMDAVERLLEAGADPNALVHERGISVLEAAAAQGQLIIVQKLLEAGAHPDHSGEGSGATPLIAAADTGHIEICKALLQSGADVSISKSYWDDISVKEVHCSAIASAGETSNITLLELFLGLVEDADEAFDQDDLNVAVAEGRQKDSARLLRTRKFLNRSGTSINNALV
ncbi:hypothetical protein FJTKL_02913 [Diaporthe vaccinii]|uniref:Ankyrin repeat protein n=1 Tax=Diaporthe vaccinii TaxID=105482 RepID=A0ABR4F348_9PEZI